MPHSTQTKQQLRTKVNERPRKGIVAKGGARLERSLLFAHMPVLKEKASVFNSGDIVHAKPIQGFPSGPNRTAGTLEVLGEDATVLHGYDVGIPSPSIGIQAELCMPQRYASSASSTASTRAYHIGIGSKREAAKHGRSPLNTQPRPSTARDFSATRLLEHGIEQCGPSLAASGVSRSFKNSCQFGL